MSNKKTEKQLQQQAYNAARKAAAAGKKTGKVVKNPAAAGKGKHIKEEEHRPEVAGKYDVMIIEAITALKERGGSSRKAMLKYIIANHIEKVTNADKAKVQINKSIRGCWSLNRLLVSLFQSMDPSDYPRM